MIPPRYIRAAMRAKYPTADFRAYFAFLASRPVLTYRRKAGLHRHHMAPREQFPELDNGMSGPNIIVLTVADHTKAHALLTKVSPALSWVRPEFIAAAQSPNWRAANAAANRRTAQDPNWRAAVTAANRRTAQDPNWRAAVTAGARKRSQDPKWRAGNAVRAGKLALVRRENGLQIPKPENATESAAKAEALRKRAYKQLVLPAKKIVAWYQAGRPLCVIARRVGTGTRPSSNGKIPRIGRIRRLLIRAGVYKKPSR